MKAIGFVLVVVLIGAACWIGGYGVGRESAETRLDGFYGTLNDLNMDGMRRQRERYEAEIEALRAALPPEVVDDISRQIRGFSLSDENEAIAIMEAYMNGEVTCSNGICTIPAYNTARFE